MDKSLSRNIHINKIGIHILSVIPHPLAFTVITLIQRIVSNLRLQHIIAQCIQHFELIHGTLGQRTGIDKIIVINIKRIIIRRHILRQIALLGIGHKQTPDSVS